MSEMDYAQPPFLLVRVQDDLHGARMTEHGLRISYERNSEFAEYRNTLHWSVNCAVADHAYGRFNEASDGSLVGKVVIIADPRELPVPAGLGEVDTWYRMDASSRADGSLERGLDVGRRATVIAPSGTAVPSGMNVVHYEGGIAARDTAIRQVLLAAGVEPKAAGMWAWQGSSEIGAWARETANKLYGADASLIHLGPHSSSLDDAIEAGARLSGMVESFETERLYTLGDGSEVPMIEPIALRVQGQRKALSGILDAMPPPERKRTGAYYEWRLASLSKLEERATAIEQAWASRFEARPTPLPVTPPPLPASPPPLPVTPPPLPVTPPPLPMAPSAHQLPQRSPEQALAAFRAGRMSVGVQGIGRAAEQFDQEVTISLSGARTANDSIKALTKAFVGSYRALTEAQDSAKAGGVVNHETSDTLQGVLRKVKDEFGIGIEQMRNDLQRLESHSPGDYGAFCQTAKDKIGRLETFWKQTAKAAPAPRM